MDNLTEKDKQEIIGRGKEAQAFMHSSLFNAFKKWVEQESSLLGVAIALDRRSKDQEKLSRIEFVEQMSGYYRGLQTSLQIFQGFVTNGNQLQSFIDRENEVNREKRNQEAQVKRLRKEAYGQSK